MIPKTKTRDTIIESIHRTRRRIAEKFSGDVAEILEDARTRQAASGRAVRQGPSTDQSPHPNGAKPANPLASSVDSRIE